MTDEALTERQRYAREYYRKNAERIKARKRAEYQGRAKVERKVLPKAAPFVTPPKAKPKPKSVITPKLIQQSTPVQSRQLSARERLENMRIEQELGLHEEVTY